MTLAWHDSCALKAETLARMHQHHRDDAIVQAVYQQVTQGTATGYRGCMIGCLLPLQRGLDDGTTIDPPRDWHYEVEKTFGIPRGVALLFDYMFEELPTDEAPGFALRSLRAVPIGGVLVDVPRRWAADMLTERPFGAQWQARRWDHRSAIAHVAHAHRNLLSGIRVDSDIWEDIRNRSLARAPRDGDRAAEHAIDAAWECCYSFNHRFTATGAHAATAVGMRAELDQRADNPDDRAGAAEANTRARDDAVRWQANRLINLLAEAPCPNAPQPEPRPTVEAAVFEDGVTEPPC